MKRIKKIIHFSVHFPKKIFNFECMLNIQQRQKKFKHQSNIILFAKVISVMAVMKFYEQTKIMFLNSDEFFRISLEERKKPCTHSLIVVVYSLFKFKTHAFLNYRFFLCLLFCHCDNVLSPTEKNLAIVHHRVLFHFI